MKKYTILVDMDDTIENLLVEWLRWLNVLYSRNVTEDDIRDWNIQKAYPGLISGQVYEPLYNNALWRHVKPKPDAMKYLRKLHDEGHEIYIVTSSNFRTIETKIKDVLFRYFPFIDFDHVILCRKKQMIRGDIMVDDGPHNLIGGDYLKILFTAAHNREFDAEAEGMIRVDNWKDIYDLISFMSFCNMERTEWRNPE